MRGILIRKYNIDVRKNKLQSAIRILAAVDIGLLGMFALLVTFVEPIDTTPPLTVVEVEEAESTIQMSDEHRAIIEARLQSNIEPELSPEHEALLQKRLEEAAADPETVPQMSPEQSELIKARLES